MRKAWTDWVKTTRKKGNRGANTMTYREAMKAAKLTWPKEKLRLERKKRREAKKKLLQDIPKQKESEPVNENVSTGA